MPYVNIRIPKEDATPDQKAQLIEGVARLLSQVLGTDPRKTVVIIDEIHADNYGTGAETGPSTQSRAAKSREKIPKPRELPENLRRYIEERKLAKDEAGALVPEETPGKDPPTTGRKKKTAE